MRQSTVFEQASCPRQSESSDWTEPEAIRRAQKGDSAAFEYLYKVHSGHVYSVCLRMLKNTAEAEEVTQEAFMQMFRKIGTFRGDSALSTWLHRITVNAVLMRLRKKTLTEVPIDDKNTDDEDGYHLPELGAADPALTGAADRLSLTAAIRELAPGYQRIFLLHDVMGYEHNEIAGLLRCSTGNSKSQLHKARLRLRRALQGTA